MPHILLDGDRLSLLDLDEFAQADPMLDVARVLTSLTGPLPHDRTWAASQAFVEEYFAHAPEAWRARLPFHYAAAVIKTAVVFFRRQKPGWPYKIEASIEKAQNSLAGRIW